MIRTLTGSDLNVPRNENYLLCEWSDGNSRVVFSFAKKGEKGLTAHIASGKRGLRKAKIAINEFCEWAFESMPWCDFIFAITDKPGIKKMCENRCDFHKLAKKNEIEALVRVRHGLYT